MKELRELTKRKESFLINNNLYPKDFMFYGLVKGGITFYNKNFKSLWTIRKKDIPNRPK